MNTAPIVLSEHLKATRNRFCELRHGGIVLHGEELEAWIRRLDTFIDRARALECLVRVNWDSQIEELLPPASVVVLETMRPNSNVIAFPSASNPNAL